MILKWLLIILIITGTAIVSDAQYNTDTRETIYGIVKDSETGEALSNVHVFLSGTTVGTTTDSTGSFSFHPRISGKFTISFSYVGYNPESYIIHLNGETGFHKYEVNLSKTTIGLDSIEVTASNKKWLKDLNEFEEQLLGKSDHSKHTYINNPWVLEFTRDKSDRLYARTKSPLDIVNKSLGYKIKLNLLEFEWARVDSRFMYLARVRFEPLSVFDESVQNRWEYRRENSYKGSFEHFLKSLYHSRVRKEGFRIFRLGSKYGVKINKLSEGELRYELMIRGVSIHNVPDVRGFKLNQAVRVEYRDPKKGTDYETRLMEPVDENGLFFIFPNGHLLNPLNVRVGGLWGVQRLADRLPINYSP